MTTILSSQAYTGPQDLHAMLGLIKARSIDRVMDFPCSLDLQELLGIPEMQVHTRLWFDPEGQLACFAMLERERDSTSTRLIFEVSSAWEDKQLEEQVIAWAETSIRQTLADHQGLFSLETSIISDNPTRITLLEGLGFECQIGGAVHMERSLGEPIEKPQLPAGFLIRPIKGEVEVEAWVRLHRLSQGTENMTCEYKLAMMRTPSYDPQLDLVAVAPEGGLAAYCVCFISSEENILIGRRIGHTDPIATHPDYRQRGLSKALVLTGLSLLKARGMDFAVLGTSSENIAMIRTAEAVGLRITKRVLWYNKPIHFDENRNGQISVKSSRP